MPQPTPRFGPWQEVVLHRLALNLNRQLLPERGWSVLFGWIFFKKTWASSARTCFSFPRVILAWKAVSSKSSPPKLSARKLAINVSLIMIWFGEHKICGNSVEASRWPVITWWIKSFSICILDVLPVKNHIIKLKNISNRSKPWWFWIPFFDDAYFI